MAAPHDNFGSRPNRRVLISGLRFIGRANSSPSICYRVVPRRCWAFLLPPKTIISLPVQIVGDVIGRFGTLIGPHRAPDIRGRIVATPRELNPLTSLPLHTIISLPVSESTVRITTLRRIDSTQRNPRRRWPGCPWRHHLRPCRSSRPKESSHCLSTLRPGRIAPRERSSLILCLVHVSDPGLYFAPLFK